jgi:putative ABC transport system permease protein
MGRHLTILGRSTIIDVEMVEDGRRHPGTFTMDDVQRIKTIPHVMEVAPHVSLPNLKASYYTESMDIRVRGVDQAFWNTIMASLREGRLTNYSHEITQASVCVVGSNLVKDLFKGLNPIGRRIQIGGMSCVVIGTLGGIQSLDTRKTAFIPLSTARQRLVGLHDIKSIRLRTDHWSTIEGVVKEVRDILRKRHHMQIARSIRVYYYPERINKVQKTVTMVRILAVPWVRCDCSDRRSGHCRAYAFRGPGSQT